MRVGQHGAVCRLVFDFPRLTPYTQSASGGTLRLAFSGDPGFPGAAPSCSGLAAFATSAGGAAITVAPGYRWHVFHVDARLVVDLIPASLLSRSSRDPLPPPAAPRAAPPALPRAAPPATVTVERGGDTVTAILPNLNAPVKPPAVASPPALSLPALSLPASAPPPAPGSVPGSAPGSAPPAAVTGSLEFDFDQVAGAAAFPRGDLGVAVFDAPAGAETPTLDTIRATPGFAAATLATLPGALALVVPLKSGQALALSPTDTGWSVVIATPPKPAAAPPQAGDGFITLPMPAARASVTIQDPAGGGDLLVGTISPPDANSQGGGKPGLGEQGGVEGPGFALLPTWLGVAVAPLSDDLALLPQTDRFRLAAASSGRTLPVARQPPGLPLAPPPTGLTRAVVLPLGDIPTLRAKREADIAAAAAAPPLARMFKDLRVAADDIALGLGPEALGALDAAVGENPAAAGNPDLETLRAIATVLSGRDSTAAFAAPGLPRTDDIALWHAIAALEAADGGGDGAGDGAGDGSGAAAAARIVAADMPLLIAQPAPLRAAILPAVAEGLVAQHQTAAAHTLLGAFPDDPGLALARAEQLEADGDTNGALAAYGALVAGADQRMAAIALDRAETLRVASGATTPAAAARTLDLHLFDWRAPGFELSLRRQIVDLLARAGSLPLAFADLNQARALFPDHAAAIDADRRALFAGMLRDNRFKTLAPLDALVLLQQNSDLIPAGAAALPLLSALADQLAALDLPGSAAPLLSRLIGGLPPGEPRARLGARLAGIDLAAGGASDALAALNATASSGIPADLAQSRDDLAAQARAAGGDAAGAIASLTPEAAPAALDTRAAIAEDSGQPQQAEQALQALVASSVPPSGTLTDDQAALVLRLATEAANSRDGATLAALAGTYGGRFPGGAAGQMFRVLTAPSLAPTASLDQALHEIGALQDVPAALDAVAPAPSPAVSAPPSD